MFKIIIPHREVKELPDPSRAFRINNDGSFAKYDPRKKQAFLSMPHKGIKEFLLVQGKQVTVKRGGSARDNSPEFNYDLYVVCETTELAQTYKLFYGAK